jgi:hypothetical protein
MLGQKKDKVEVSATRKLTITQIKGAPMDVTFYPDGQLQFFQNNQLITVESRTLEIINAAASLIYFIKKA